MSSIRCADALRLRFARALFFTTEGTKTDAIAAHPEVCFQVEEIHDESHWQSVMVLGQADRLTDMDEIDRAMLLILERHRLLRPVINRMEMGIGKRPYHEAVYRIRPSRIDGRKIN